MEEGPGCRILPFARSDVGRIWSNPREVGGQTTQVALSPVSGNLPESGPAIRAGAQPARLIAHVAALAPSEAVPAA